MLTSDVKEGKDRSGSLNVRSCNTADSIEGEDVGGIGGTISVDIVGVVGGGSGGCW